MGTPTENNIFIWGMIYSGYKMSFVFYNQDNCEDCKVRLEFT